MELIKPISYLLGLTLFSLIIMLISRIKAVKSGALKTGYFKIFQNKAEHEVPEKVILIGRHFQNLIELPLIFYFMCLFAIQFNLVKEVELWAWLFVWARFCQSIIHLTINHVLMRMLSYALGVIALICMWISIIGKFYL